MTTDFDPIDYLNSLSQEEKDIALDNADPIWIEGFSQDEIDYAFDCVRPPMLVCNLGSEEDLLESLRGQDVTNSSILISDNDWYDFEPIEVPVTLEETHQRYLWKYENKYCYYGQINGIFLATQEEIDLVFTKPRTVYLGEALGKHSDVRITVTKADFVKLASDYIPEKYLKDFCMGYDILEAFLEPHKDEIKYSDNEAEVKAYLKDQDIEDLEDFLKLN